VTGTNAGPCTPSEDVVTNYKGVMMTRGEANRLRAADPNGPVIVPVGTPPKVPDRATTKAPEPPEGGDDPTPEDNPPVVIPPQLHGCRFILLKPKRKEPLEYWKEQNYAHDSPRLLQHIRQGGNYGVMVTGDLCVLDADNVPALYDEPFFSDLIENSFMVSTGRAPIPGAHIYFRCPDLPPIKTVLKTATGKDLGDVRGPDSMTYVVGPGSIHPDTGKTYEITNDVAPVTVPLEKVRAFIDRYDVKKKAKPKRTAEARTDAPQRHNSANISESLGLKVTDFLMPDNPQYRGDEIIGNHPIHGGDTGTNLSVNPRKNEWRCWHHESGGGPLEALAVADRIIDCSEAGPGCLQEQWSAIFDALKKRGYAKQLAEMDRERRGLKPPAKKQTEANTPPPEGEPKADPPDGLPEIIVNGRDLNEVTEDTIRALCLYNHPPKIFVRSGRLVRIESDEKGFPKIAKMNKDAVRGQMSYAAHFIRVLKDNTQTTIYPPMDIVFDVMALGKWPFPSLKGIIEAPGIRPDGTIITKAGYDEATCLYYFPTEEFRNITFSVPDNPTQEDIDAAKKIIAEIICDFPFVDNACRINAIAAMITPVVRNLVKGPVPMGLFDKPQPGTGASLLTEMIVLISTGRPAAMLTAPTNADEWRKMITSTLREGRGVVIIDNIEGKLYSPVLAALLTSETWLDRLLGKSEMATLAHRTIWIGNGNNIQLGGDLPRRCFWARLDAQMARPQERESFQHEDLRGWVKEHRPDILSAILVLTRAWVMAGKPEPEDLPRVGSFEGWVRTIGGILSHAGYTGFLGNQREMYDANDIDTPQWEAFLKAWSNIWGDSPVTAAAVTARLEHNNDLVEALPDYLAEAYLERQKSFVRVLGRALSSKKDMRYPSGLSIIKGRLENRAVQWKVVDTKKESTK